MITELHRSQKTKYEEIKQTDDGEGDTELAYMQNTQSGNGANINFGNNISISSENPRENNDLYEPDDPMEPYEIFCPYCNCKTMSLVKTHSTIWSYIAALIAFMIFGLISICVVPLLWKLLEEVHHTCYRCRTVLAKKKKYTYFKFREKIVTIRIGTCALVSSRRYVISFLMLLFFLITFFLIKWYISFSNFLTIPKGPLIDVEWEEFLSDCGQKSYLGNPIKANKIFNDKYNGKTVKWEGRVHHIQEGMNPPYYPRNDYRDIFFLFNSNLLSKIQEVDAGDLINFESTLLEFGRRGHPHLGLLWDFNILTKFNELPPMDKKRQPKIILFTDAFRGPLAMNYILHQMLKPEKDIPLLVEPRSEDNLSNPNQIDGEPQLKEISHNETTPGTIIN